MNMLELRLICDNVKMYGGFREKEILKDIIRIELEDNNNIHKVYVFYNSDENYFKYDFKSHKIVGLEG